MNGQSRYLRPPVSNGNAHEQALIRRWWHERQDKRGLMIWEYALQGRYLDAVWIPGHDGVGLEESGNTPSQQRSIATTAVVLCEAKARALSFELIGQALVYTKLATRAGATVERTVVFAQTADPVLRSAAEELGLEVEVRSLDE